MDTQIEQRHPNPNPLPEGEGEKIDFSEVLDTLSRVFYYCNTVS